MEFFADGSELDWVVRDSRGIIIEFANMTQYQAEQIALQLNKAMQNGAAIGAMDHSRTDEIMNWNLGE